MTQEAQAPPSPSVLARMLEAFARWDAGSSARGAVVQLWAVAGLAFVVVTLQGPPGPVLHPDTPGYLSWAAHRPPLYPLILKGWQALFGSVETIGYVQLALLSVALAWLAAEIYHLTRSRLAGALVLLATLGRAHLLSWIFPVLTDGPFASCVVVTAAALLGYARDPRARWLVIASTSIGLGLGLRPVAWSLVPTLPLALWLVGPVPLGRRRLTAALAPVLALGCSWSGIQAVRHADSPPRSHGRHSLMGKVAFIRAAPSRGRFASIAEDIQREMEPARRVDRQLDSMAARFHWRAPEYDRLRFQILREPLERASLATGLAPDWIGGEVALDIIRAEPWQYLYDVLLNAYAMWLPPNLLTRAQAAELETLFASHPLGLEHPLVGRNWLLIALIKLFYLAAFAASVIGAGLALWRRLHHRQLSPALAVSAVLSIAVHGYIVVVALVQAGLSRYGLMIWPLQVTMVAIGGAVLLRSLLRMGSAAHLPVR